ncbi:tripartite-type tricarboxylate transporter receptor subunit TctC [Variovorax beijingensis]|uniref:Tripartite-type tricarboxylate transporter receptor subunit TctC n=2 Tax=Variovorax TaxID=34072 RepID=A0AAE3Y115_VARPD|nr:MULTISPECIES: tripartite tricarboxylate transporter substrate binding protein [Variovorax]MDR6427403.1 tripartite-type tricarboxylate transporter receptor subunit TctC [Variovorax paradoxus]MDR6454565.1 tripartite-type tricarboxylate transporter receptor subunit TctC [Variovorax paradoxus]TWD85644.1 tripartite-type tricarboxylate transporter receptor subunit TctC [Variovorax beijingensis]
MPSFPLRAGASRRLAIAAASLVAGATLLAPAGVLAQASYPSRPIRLIVPFPAGGGTDLIAREVANKVATSNGWSIVIDNKPGSGGNLGVDAAAKAAPDGYTLVLGQTSNLAINPTLYAKLPYNPEKDLTPVGLVASAPLVLVVAADSPYKTLADVVAAAKARPETLNYASSGSGTVAHLATELFQKTANVRFTHVPYKGAAQGSTDLIGGQIQMYMSSVPTLIGHIKSGKMRPIVVTSRKRTTDLPDTPTVDESGYKGFEAATWFGIAGPAGLPKDVVAKLNAAFNKALQDPEVKRKLASQGAEVKGSTPEEFGAYIREETVRWGKVVKDSGAKVD